MSIKTWEERQEDDDHQGMSIDYAEQEINELRAALAERDAEIERLKSVPMKYRRMAFNAELQEEVAAQRKVLEQAIFVLLRLKRIEGVAWESSSHKAAAKAITAIKEVLHAN